jgi:hypothetical protein
MPSCLRPATLLLLLLGCSSAPPRLADGGVDFTTSRCDAITDARACAARADCAADYCSECSCTPAFKRCRAVQEAPVMCPALGCAEPLCCLKQTDCAQNLTCAPPGTPNGCGACNTTPGSCTADSECTGQKICDFITCSCTQQKTCVDGCEARGCSPEAACGADHRCHPKACADASGCPAQFACTGGACVRQTCSSPSGCPGGFCVQGSCYDGKGVCTPPTP